MVYSRKYSRGYRPKAFLEVDDEAGGEVTNEAVDEAMVAVKATVTGKVSETGGKVSLTEADIVVAGGRGIRA